MEPIENITLIGMSGVGKTTIGKLVAMGTRQVIDTDDLIRKKFKPHDLDDLIVQYGPEWFLDMECRIICEHTWPSHLSFVATPGGSVIARDKSMKKLCQISTVIYLKAPYEVIERRIGGSFVGRGITLPEGWSYEELYNDRTTKYERWAHRTVNAADSKVGVAAKVLGALSY